MFSLFLSILPIMIPYSLCFRFFIRMPNYMELLLDGVTMEMVHSIRSSSNLLQYVV